MAKADNGDLIAIPYSASLMYSCVGCHSASGQNTWKDSATNAPIVYNHSAPTYGANGLAGGNFYYVLSDQNKGHNVLGITGEDTMHGNTPPNGSDLGGQITCAGVFGCHGQMGASAPPDQVTAMKYAHHATTPKTGEESVAGDYRFLKGITGKEDGDWEQDNINTSHNEYKGASGFSDTKSISYVCYKCHGYYHDPSGSFSFEHPSNVTLSSYPAGTYSMVTPVARPEDNYTGSPTNVRVNVDFVMCLSCHRAHSSPYGDMMRWNYPGDATPCLNCHDPIP